MMNKFAKQRSGSVYVIVLGTSMLVATFMMAGLMLIRVKRSSFQRIQDMHQARLNAESSLELCLHYIRENPTTWRSSTPSFSLIYGSNPGYDFTVEDPSDGNLLDSYNDPVLVTATGKSGQATQYLRARLNQDAVGYNCLMSAIHCAKNIVVDASNVTVTESLSYDVSGVLRNSATIGGNAAGFQQPVIDDTSNISGSLNVPGDTPRDLPSTDSVDPFTYYVNNGVSIDVSGLWLSDHSLNRLTDAEFGAGVDEWEAFECQLQLDSNGYAQVSSQTNARAGLAQDVSSLMYTDGEYQLQCAVFSQEKNATSAQIWLRIESSVDGVQYFSSGTTACKSGAWTLLDGVVTPTWNGSLVNAKWMVTMQFDGLAGSSFPVFSVYQPRLKDISYPDQSYVIKNQLISPKHNPFGAGQTQSEGIYVLDANSKEVYIENSRFFGTLVLQNSANVSIQKSVNMSNFVYNYPVLMVNGNLSMKLDSEPLHEIQAAVNFNPINAGYIGTSDVDLDDSYSSRIDGLIYVHNDLEIQGALQTTGVILVNGDLSIVDALVNVEHRKLFYVEPPHGFIDFTDLTILPGSFSRAVSSN